MANAAGAKFAEPAAPAVTAQRRGLCRRCPVVATGSRSPRQPPLPAAPLQPAARKWPEPAARRCTSRPARSATPPASPTRRSSATRPPGRLACARRASAGADRVNGKGAMPPKGGPAPRKRTRARPSNTW
jgi:hypothetical protein